MTTRGSTKPTPPPDTFFDLSFRGGLPEILRAIADRLDAGEVHAEGFDWQLRRGQLELTAHISMEPKE